MGVLRPSEAIWAEIFGPSLLRRARSVDALVFLDGAQIVGPRLIREQTRP